ncbi:hypothetical protein PENTCL1PPCAC_334, partial [Pristionchus entomophagus]
MSSLLISSLLATSVMAQWSGSNCPLGQVQLNGNCVSLAAPGSACQASEQCLDFSICTNQRCNCTNPNAVINSGYCIIQAPSCKQGMTLMNGQCVYLSMIGYQCQASSQCLGGSNCVNAVCTCPSTHSSMSGYCVPNQNAAGNGNGGFGGNNGGFGGNGGFGNGNGNGGF